MFPPTPPPPPRLNVSPREMKIEPDRRLTSFMTFDLNLYNKFVIRQESKSQYVYNKHNTPWKVYAYSIYALVGLYQKSYSFATLTLSISDA